MFTLKESPDVSWARAMWARIFIAALISTSLVLGGCGTSSGGGAVTKTQGYDCNDDLILPEHRPEECSSDSQPATVKAPELADPIFGTYLLYLTEVPGKQVVFRIHPDYRAAIDDDYDSFRWEKRGDAYNFYYDKRSGFPEEYQFSLKIKDLEGEPDITAFGSKGRDFQFEGIKLSSDSDFLFDFYRVTRTSRKNVLDCVNIGRKERQGMPLTLDKADSADTLAECEALCVRLVGTKSKLICPRDTR